MMKNARLFRIGTICLLLIGCGSSYELELQASEVAGKLKLAVQMQRVFAQDVPLAYQEINDVDWAIRDSLLMTRIDSESSLASFVQQQINQLRLLGYSISDEKAQKSQVKTAESSYDTLLKTYQIVNTTGTLLYMAHYAVHKEDGQILMISYASEQKAARTAFVNSLKNLTFS